MNEMVMQQFLGQIDIESTPAPVVARQVAEREQRMSQMIERLADATGADVDPIEVNVEQRQALILQAAEAIISQSFGSWWWEVIGPEVIDRPDLATEYAGISGEKWNHTLRRWYQTLHKDGRIETPVGEASPAAIGEMAEKYCRGVFGVSLREFVQTVVNWTPQQAVESLIAGPTDEMMQQFETIVEHVEEQE